MKIVLIGPPASGKGTQGRLLAKQKKIPYLSTGALLRSQVDKQTEAGLEADKYLKQGQYVPDELIFPMVEEWLQEQNQGWVLDGFPRTLPQALEFDQRVSTSLVALYLDAPFDVLAARVVKRVECSTCGHVSHIEKHAIGSTCKKCQGSYQVRADDDFENFRSRYQQFEELTLPIVSFYQNKGYLKQVDGTGSPDDVFTKIQSELL